MRLVSPPEMVEGGSALLYVTGRVEVCFNHAWGTVCQSEWQFNSEDAAMICQQLGLSPEGKHKKKQIRMQKSEQLDYTDYSLSLQRCCGDLPTEFNTGLYTHLLDKHTVLWL